MMIFKIKIESSKNKGYMRGWRGGRVGDVELREVGVVKDWGEKKRSIYLKQEVREEKGLKGMA